MALLDRVTTLIKANLNDLVDQAENPEKLLKQLLLDMQNQFMQVKTQVAIAIADQHLLEKKKAENSNLQNDWMRKAELAVAHNQEELARTALERALTYENAAANFAQQLEDQSHQVATLRDALGRLEHKMAETKAKADILIAQHRRARTAMQAGTSSLQSYDHDAAFERLQAKVTVAEALGQGRLGATQPNVEQQLTQLERAGKVDRLLSELKQKRIEAGD
jgi:phage shock protein A